MTLPPHPSFRGWTRVFSALPLAIAIASVVTTAGVAAGQKPAADALKSYVNIPLWDEGKVPLATGNGPLDKPFLTAMLPPEGKRNGGSIIVAPGGSNIMLMYGGEGIDAAERYNDWGVAAFVLTYRMSPRYNNDARVLDGKRAVQIIRAHAREWKLEPARIGYIGFSAGSNIARAIVSTSTAGDAAAADPMDRVSSRPDYLALVYGPGSATPGESLKTFPPTFLVSAAGDAGPSLGNAQFFMDLTRAGAVAEIHVYQKGRHGFGTGYGSPEFGDWMTNLERFVRLNGFLQGVQ